MPIIQGINILYRVQFGNDRHGDGGGDPFSNRLEAFLDVGVVKYIDNEGVLETVKWLDHALGILV